MLSALAISICIALVAAGEQLKLHTGITDVQYGDVPAIFKLDDYDTCLALRDPTLYCFVTFELSAINEKEPSSTWKIIEELNSVPRNYRHDLLRHGLCLPRTCSQVGTEDYAPGGGSRALRDGLSKCYTERYKYFGLRAQVAQLDCVDKRTGPIEFDATNIAYSVYITSFLALILLGNLYDLTTKPKTTNECGCVRKFFLCFSLRRNIQHFLSPSQNSDDLGMFNGVRFIYVCYAIVAHSMMLSLASPVFNTKFAEEVTLKPQHALFLGGGMMYQTFFLMSGWLMSYRVFKAVGNDSISCKDLVKMLFLRVVRVLPMLVLVIGFISTCYKHLNNGPVWKHLVDLEYSRCRSNSVWSFLFLSNYYKSDEMCLHQSWFVSAEMQMYILGLFIIKLVSSQRKQAMFIFIFFILAGLGISYYDAYYNKLPITTRLYPETIYNAFSTFDSWLHINISGHSQMPAFVQGLLCGYYYYKYKNENRKCNVGMILQILFQGLLWILAMGIMCSACLFYQEGFDFTLKESALYHSLAKYLFTLPISAGMFGALFGIGTFIKCIFSARPLQIFGKATFSVFLVHMIVIKTRLGVMRSPLYLSNYTLIVQALGDATVSFILGTLIHVIFELPISGVVKALAERKIEAKQEEADKKKKN